MANRGSRLTRERLRSNLAEAIEIRATPTCFLLSRWSASGGASAAPAVARSLLRAGCWSGRRGSNPRPSAAKAEGGRSPRGGGSGDRSFSTSLKGDWSGRRGSNPRPSAWEARGRGRRRRSRGRRPAGATLDADDAGDLPVRQRTTLSSKPATPACGRSASTPPGSSPCQTPGSGWRPGAGKTTRRGARRLPPVPALNRC